MGNTEIKMEAFDARMVDSAVNVGSAAVRVFVNTIENVINVENVVVAAYASMINDALIVLDVGRRAHIEDADGVPIVERCLFSYLLKILRELFLVPVRTAVNLSNRWFVTE